MSQDTPSIYYVPPRVQSALDELAAAVTEYQEQGYGGQTVYVPDEHLAQRGLEVSYCAMSNLLILRTVQPGVLQGEVVEHYSAQQAHEEELAAVTSGNA